MNTNLTEITDRAKPAIDRISTLAHDATDKAVNAKNQAAVWLSDRGDELAAAPKKLVDHTSNYVSANPLKSLGIAIVAALVVGRLMK